MNNTNNRVLRNSQTKYFLPRVNITICNILIDGRNYDQPISDLVKQYDEIRKSATGQKELDADSRAIQQIKFRGMLKTNSHVCTV